MSSFSFFLSRCPICMNDFIPGELIRLLPCMHYYHIRCIDEWLMRAITCPTCVQRVDTVPPPTHQTSRSTPRHNHRRTGSTISQGSTSSLCGSAYRRSMDVLTTPPPTQSPSVSPADSMQELLVEVQYHS